MFNVLLDISDFQVDGPRALTQTRASVNQGAVSKTIFVKIISSISCKCNITTYNCITKIHIQLYDSLFVSLSRGFKVVGKILKIVVTIRKKNFTVVL